MSDAESNQPSVSPLDAVTRVRNILVGEEVRHTAERFDELVDVVNGLEARMSKMETTIAGMEEMLGWLKGDSLAALEVGMKKHLELQAKRQRADLDVEIARVRCDLDSLRLRYEQVSTMLHMMMETNSDMAAKLQDYESEKI